MTVNGNISSLLLDPKEAVTLEVQGNTKAGVLVALFEQDEELNVVFTRRRDDLRNHPGEISFPGGRRDYPTEPLLETALREATEEIGLQPEHVHLLGALRPISTFVTGFAVYPFVAAVPPIHTWQPSADEVAEIIELPLSELRERREQRRLIRRGVPFRTVVYPVSEVGGKDIIWGATARILEDLLNRLDVSPLSSR